MQFIKLVHNLDEDDKKKTIVSSLNIFNEHFLGGKIFEWVTKDAPSLAITTCVSIRYRIKL